MKNITELSLKNRDLVWYFVIVTFIAGMRALRDYQLKFDAAAETSNLLSTGVDKMAAQVAE